MAKKKRDISNWTQPRQFRLSDETLTELDLIVELFALKSRADAIRLAAHRLVIAEERAGRRAQPKEEEAQEE